MLDTISLRRVTDGSLGNRGDLRYPSKDEIGPLGGA